MSFTKRIVYNRRSDGGVTVCCPAPDILHWLSCGGLWRMVPRGFEATQIERQIARGVQPDAARRYVRAMLLGGCTTQEALAIIRDRDCAHLGTAIELWDASDLPIDRWFRDAWRRSHNGGPVLVDLGKARRIQFKKIKTAVAAHNRTRLALARKPLVPSWGEIGNAIRHVRDEDELRRVWPSAVTPPAGAR